VANIKEYFGTTTASHARPPPPKKRGGCKTPALTMMKYESLRAYVFRNIKPNSLANFSSKDHMLISQNALNEDSNKTIQIH